MKAVLDAIGLNATLQSRHLRMVSCSLGYDVLIVLTPVDVLAFTVFGALAFLVLVETGARTIAASFYGNASIFAASIITTELSGSLVSSLRREVGSAPVAACGLWA